MDPALNFFTVLLAVGVVQGVLAGIALWQMAQGRPLAKHLLVALLLVVVVDLAYGLLFTSHYILMVPHLVRLNTPVVFLYGPLIYFYVRAVADPGFTWQQHYRWHGLPALLCVLFLLPVYAQDAAAKHTYIAQLFLHFPMEVYISGAAKRLHMGAYLLMTVIWLRQQRGMVERSASLLVFPLALLGVFGVVWMLDVGDYVLNFRLGTAADIVQLLLATALLVTVTYLAVTRPRWLVGEEEASASTKYVTSSLSNTERQTYLARLQRCMETDQAYLDPNLTLPNLARYVRLSPHQLSQVLNEQAGQNFATFVNGYRVEAVKDRLATDGASTTLAAIAFDCGFNAISTFNAVFKKHTGLTPSGYRRQLAKASQRLQRA